MTNLLKSFSAAGRPLDFEQISSYVFKHKLNESLFAELSGILTIFYQNYIYQLLGHKRCYQK